MQGCMTHEKQMGYHLNWLKILYVSRTLFLMGYVSRIERCYTFAHFSTAVGGTKKNVLINIPMVLPRDFTLNNAYKLK